MSRKTAFEKMKEGLDEALAIARGDAQPVKLFIPAEIDVKAIQTKLKLTQEDFAALFGFTVNQILVGARPCAPVRQRPPYSSHHRERLGKRSRPAPRRLSSEEGGVNKANRTPKHVFYQSWQDSLCKILHHDMI